MIYSRADKVEQYLSHYNITGVESQKGSQSTRFYLTNIHTNKPYKLEIQHPLYNILSGEDSHHEFDPHGFRGHKYILRNMMFDSVDKSMEDFVAQFLNTEYFYRYGTMEHEVGKKQSSEYFSFLEMKDVELIKALSGFKDNVITGVYGNFFTMDDDTLRFMFKPTTPIVENIDKVHFAQSFVFTKDGWQYPAYHIIYTKKGSTDVQFEWTNLLANSITGKGTVTVNLSQLFGDKWSTIESDMVTMNGYNESQFIVPTLFSCAIMRNTPTGIIRFIPINYTTQFFNIIFNNMGVSLDIERYDGGGQKNTTPNFNDSNTELEDIDFTPSEKVSFIYKDDRIVPWSSMEHAEFLDQLLALSSTASYFNDVLFSMNDSEFQFPVYLISSNADLSAHGPYGTQFNDVVIDNVGIGND